VAALVVLPFKLVLDEKERKSLTNVTRWFKTVVNQPQLLAVVGPVTLVKAAVKAPTAPAKAAAAAAPAKAAILQRRTCAAVWLARVLAAGRALADERRECQQQQLSATSALTAAPNPGYLCQLPASR
jgi:hypothetical protein